MSSNPYESAEVWEVSEDIMPPVGIHEMRIEDIKGDELSRHGNPQVELRVSGSAGSMRHWITLTTNTLGQVLNLADSTGVRRPTADDLAGPNSLALDPSYLVLFLGKPCRVKVIEEESYKDRTKMRKVINGFLPSKGDSDNGSSGGVEAEDLPF